jgi:hypothetical protein
MMKLTDDHRCYGQLPEIIVCDFVTSSKYGFGLRQNKLGIWLSDGETIWGAADVSVHPTYYQSMRAAMEVAVDLQKRNNWPIYLYSGGTGFADHNRIQVNDELDIIQHILKHG